MIRMSGFEGVISMTMATHKDISSGLLASCRHAFLCFLAYSQHILSIGYVKCASEHFQLNASALLNGRQLL
jgi:hypothetical protein